VVSVPEGVSDLSTDTAPVEGAVGAVCSPACLSMLDPVPVPVRGAAAVTGAFLLMVARLDFLTAMSCRSRCQVVGMKCGGGAMLCEAFVWHCDRHNCSLDAIPATQALLFQAMDKDTEPYSTDDLRSSGLTDKGGHKGTQGEQDSDRTVEPIRSKPDATSDNMTADQLDSSSEGEDCTSRFTHVLPLQRC
jgi:hypothetical protein